jgi:hypothetical protein
MVLVHVIQSSEGIGRMEGIRVAMTADSRIVGNFTSKHDPGRKVVLIRPSVASLSQSIRFIISIPSYFESLFLKHSIFFQQRYGRAAARPTIRQERA